MAVSRASRAIKLFGTEETTGKQKVLTAGDITAVLDNGGLRYIRYRGVEVLRAIAFLVRDRNWGTYPATISNLRVKQLKDGFSASYHGECRDALQEIHYDARIEAKDGMVRFAARGVPKTDFLTNRTGFVVLHPLTGIVGAPVEIVHTNGKKEKARFPKYISPGQPVFEISSLKHTVVPGVTATVQMDGNKFEMEDHRNWMDASYKTYVCSLLDPWPYTLPAGTPFDQAITLTIAGKPSRARRPAQSSVVRVDIGKGAGFLPRIGAGVPMAEAAHAVAHADKIKALNLAELVCQIDGRRDGQAEAARNFAALSRHIDVPVKLEIILPAKEAAAREMQTFADAVRAGGLKPASLVVTHMYDLKSFQPNTPRPWGPTYEEMAAAARTEFPGIPVGGGMLSYFTELNRKPVPHGIFDYVTHTVCPIVHAADDVSVLETLQSLPSIFASARRMIGKTEYHIGPSSIPCRDNPYGAAVADNPDNKRVCLADHDPRQRGLLAATWTLGLAAAAADGSVNSIALGSVTGPQGAIHVADGSFAPWYGQNGTFYPVYHVVRGLASAGRAKRLSATVVSPDAVTALAFRQGSQTECWLANKTAERQQVKLAGLKGKGRVWSLDESSFEPAATASGAMADGGKLHAASQIIELKPYAVVRLVLS